MITRASIEKTKKHSIPRMAAIVSGMRKYAWAVQITTKAAAASHWLRKAVRRRKIMRKNPNAISIEAESSVTSTPKVLRVPFRNATFPTFGARPRACAITSVRRSRMVQATPRPMPKRTSRPTIGMRYRRESTPVQEINACGQCRRAYGSRATYSIHNTNA